MEVSLGKRIAYRRQELGLSQAELAERVGVHKITLSSWERDRVKPLRHFAVLASALKVSTDWLESGPAKTQEFTSYIEAAQSLYIDHGKKFLEYSVQLSEALSKLRIPAAERERIKDIREKMYGELMLIVMSSATARRMTEEGLAPQEMALSPDSVVKEVLDAATPGRKRHGKLQK